MKKNYYIDYSEKGNPIKELKSKYGNPPFRNCGICDNDGKCRDEDIFDCWNYLIRKRSEIND